MVEALDIHVKGIVQGVGFRPFVYRLAKKYLVNGWVLNATDGVFIHAEAETHLLDGFVNELHMNPPAAAVVKEVDLKEVPLEDFADFEIRYSDHAAVERTTLVSPDLATCDDCVRELFDPADRRYRYPFINCTNCGPRFTIIDSLPYDRAATSMKDFPMCPTCAAEYADPLDRRFHAQPDACFTCGPTISWTEREDIASPLCHPERAKRAEGSPRPSNTSWSTPRWGRTREQSDAIFARAVELLLAGGIVAVKGLGGFHLVCDASNAQAVATLRARKRRQGKAFAVMVATPADARQVCEVDEAEQQVLASTQRPIVLLRKRPGASIAPGVADNLPELGIMLPCTPVQHLLLHDFAAARAAAQPQAEGPAMLVMTSGNVHDEPIVTDDVEAQRALGAIADAILGNNRAIRSRYDDSVVRVIRAANAGEALQTIRRARGYAPLPLVILSEQSEPKDPPVPSSTSRASADGSTSADNFTTPVLLACGSEQKSTLALVRAAEGGAGEAFVSQHIGDVENAETFDAWLDASARYQQLFEAAPTHLACDLHPEYLTAKWAREQAAKRGLPLTEVQHHHAHIASVLGENKLFGPVCGIAFDGTGYGADGRIWGGEVLLTNTRAYERFANFAYVPMPGGAAAIKYPLRMAYGVLWAFDLLDHPAAADVLAALGDAASVCDQMIERGLNTPLTSSVGRLFDAAAALLGICTEATYEGEPAILLEAALTQPLAPCHPERSAAMPDAALCHPERSGEAAQPKDPHAPSSTSRASADALAGTDDSTAADRYAIAVVKNTATAGSTAQDTSVVLFDAAPTFRALLDDRAAGVPVPVIAQRFHDAFVGAIRMAAELVRSVYGISDVALSGGVFMNRYLAEHALAALADAGFTVAVNRDLPPNDGCISYGQSVVAWAKLTDEQAPAGPQTA